MIVALIAAAASAAASAQAPSGFLVDDRYHPGLKVGQLAVDSLIENTVGRYAVMGMDLDFRTSFVMSEGSIFSCDSFQLLPAACALWLERWPLSAVVDFAPHDLLEPSWLGDRQAAANLAASLGRDLLERWLVSGTVFATTLSDDPSGMPYETTVWDALVMLALVDRPGADGQPPMSDTLSGMLAGLLPADAWIWGTASFRPGGCRAALVIHLASGRRLGLAFFADSLESDNLVIERLRLMTAVVGTATLHPPGFAE